jgi:hypothetical protein
MVKVELFIKMGAKRGKEENVDTFSTIELDHESPDIINYYIDYLRLHGSSGTNIDNGY